jgi:hypothetical protein
MEVAYCLHFNIEEDNVLCKRPAHGCRCERAHSVKDHPSLNIPRRGSLEAENAHLWGKGMGCQDVGP